MQSDLFSVTKVLAKMGNVVRYPKTEFIALLFSHGPSQAKFIRLIFDNCDILIWMLTHLSFDFEKYLLFS